MTNQIAPQADTKVPDWRQWTRREHDGQWLAPAVTDEIRSSAGRCLEVLEKRMAQANADQVRQWLKALGLLCAGRISADDARAKADAYVSLLEFPAGCYNKHTLRTAGERFRFWPTYAELSEFLRDEERRLYLDRYRLGLISAPAKKPEPKIDRSPEAAARMRDAMADAIKSLKATP